MSRHANRKTSRQRSCQYKVKHKSKDEAEIALKRLKQQGHEQNLNPLNVYFCIHCSHYHVGHKPTKVVQDESIINWADNQNAS